MIVDNLYQGDCADLLKRVPDESVDMIFTDPPYGNTNLNLDKRAVKWDSVNKELLRVLKPFGIFMSFTSVELGAAFLQYWKFRFDYIWIKANGMPVHNSKKPINVHERIWVFCKPDCKVSCMYMDKEVLRVRGAPYVNKFSNKSEFNLQQGCNRDFITRNSGYREGTSILFAKHKPIMAKSERTSHPTQKPLDLCTKLIQAYCPKGGTVLDPFVGSGTIPLAAKMSGRHYIGMEISKDYLDIARKRIALAKPNIEEWLVSK